MRSLFVTVLILIALTAPGWATIDLVHEETFVVDGLDSAIVDARFNDIDHDGYPEIWATDNYRAVLYSTGSHATLLTIEIDSLLTRFGYVLSDRHRMGGPVLLLDDINRDSVPDPLVAFWMEGGMYGAIMPRGYHFLVYDNILSDTGTAEMGFGFAPYLGLKVLESMDMDDDGYNELVVSLDSMFVNPDPVFFQTRSIGQTLVYHSFPDSLAHQQANLLADLGLLRELEDMRFYVASAHSFQWRDWHSQPQTDEYTSRLLVLEPDAGLYAGFDISKPIFCYDDLGVDLYTILHMACTGDIDSEFDNREVLSAVTWRQAAWAYDGGNFTKTCDTAGIELVMHQQTTFYTLQEKWRIDITGEQYSNFIYLPDFPGYFFAFCNGQFTQFWGKDGSVNQSTDIVPEGDRRWDYPYPDSLARLIVTNGNEIALYRPDIVTGVEDDNPSSLPGTFDVSHPYPNPFNPSVSFSVFLPERSRLKVEVYNTLGRKVAVLHDGPARAGETRLDWDGSGYASGVYFFRAGTGNQSRIVKAVLLK